jgi:hypothetical protein
VEDFSSGVGWSAEKRVPPMVLGSGNPAGEIDQFCQRRTIMNARTLSAAIVGAGLLAVSGAVFAAGDAHEPYYRALPGDSGSRTQTETVDTMGKAAYGMPSEANPWSGHEAYDRAMQGKLPPSRSAEKMDGMGKAAYGRSDSGIDGHAAYHSAFTGD